MASSGSGDRSADKAKDLRLLLPFSFNDLRIPDELVKEIGSSEARIFGPSAKTWPVEVGQDRDGAFLGLGWPEFAAACGAGEGWILVMRHHGDGLLTVKAFDASCCLRELGTPPPPAVEATTSTITAPCKPHFISVDRPQDFMQKMLIPAKFVEQYIPKENLKNNMAILIGPLGKECQMDLEMMNQPHVFCAGAGWSHFLELHDITKDNILVLNYEGGIKFRVKVFEPDGFPRLYNHEDIRIEQVSKFPDMLEVQKASIENHKRNNVASNSDEQKEPKGSMTSLKKASLRRNTFYGVGQPSWIKKEINDNTIRKELSLAKSFCNAIGLRERCKITIKTSENSTESWEVHGHPGKKSSYLLRPGWRRFCQENGLRQGDICTFHIIKTTLWHVDITRCKEFYKTPSSSSSKGKSKDGRPSSKGQKRKISSVSKCDYQIGPAAWIQKKINTSKIENRLYLSTFFCEAIGLLKPRVITLKTSLDSTMSWEVLVSPHKKSCHHVTGLGWKRFYQENGIKVGDVCTFNIVEKNLWLAVITPSIS